MTTPDDSLTWLGGAKAIGGAALFFLMLLAFGCAWAVWRQGETLDADRWGSYMRDGFIVLVALAAAWLLVSWVMFKLVCLWLVLKGWHQ